MQVLYFCQDFAFKFLLDSYRIDSLGYFPSYYSFSLHIATQTPARIAPVAQ